MGGDSPKYKVNTSAFNFNGSIKSIYIGTVKAIGGSAPVNPTNPSQTSSDRRFQSDNSMIRCEIKGLNFDDSVPISELPNCLPLLPKHINIVPKIGEAVLLFTFAGPLETEERLYVGPIISQMYNLNNERFDDTALDGFGFGNSQPKENINNLPPAEGVYPKSHEISIQGRDNSDLIFKNNEVLLRAGKHAPNDPKKFNEKNPSYIQIKHNLTLKEEEDKPSPLTSQPTRPTPLLPETGVNVSGAINVVSNKINLLTHDKGRPRYTLNDRTNMISDEELNKIINKAHPLVFGDKLIEYLKLLRAALDNHVHPFPGRVMEDQDGKSQIADWQKFPLDSLISKNIKIN